MARRKKLLVPEAEKAVNSLKGELMEREGFLVDPASPNDVKYEVAKSLDVPLTKEYNGELTSKQAGKVGGKLGGSMVKERVQKDAAMASLVARPL